MSRKGSRSPPARELLAGREKSRANPGRVYQPLHSQADSAGREQAEHRAKSDLAALTLLHDLSTRLLAVDRLEPVLQEIVDVAVGLVGTERGTLQLIEGESLRIVAQHGHQQAFLNAFAFAENQATAWGEAVRCRQRVIMGDVENSPLCAHTALLKLLRDAGVRAVQSTPLLTRQGKLLGILTTHWAIPHVPDEHDLWRIDLLARQAADLVEHKQAEEALRNANEDLRVRAEQLQTANDMLRNKQQALETAHEDLLVQEQQLRSHAEALQASQERLALAASGARIGLYDWNVVTEEAFWTEQVSRLLGLRTTTTTTTTTTTVSQKYHYHDWAECVHPEDRPRVQAEERRCMAERLPYETEYRVVWPDGSMHWLADRGVFQHDPEGCCTRMLGILMDITERKRAQESLRASEQRYRELFEANVAGVYLSKLDGTILDCNDAMVRMVGCDARGEVLGRSTADFYVHPDLRQGLVHLLQRDGAVPAREALLRQKDGAIRHVFGSAALLAHGQTDEPYVQGVVIDITQRMQAEEALREKQAELQLVADATPVLLTRLSRDLRYVFVNRACAEWFGRPPDEIVGKPIVEVMGREAFETIRPYVERVLQGQRVEYETQIPYQGIGTRFMHVTYIPERNAQGQVTGWLASVLDITERKQAEAALREAKEQLEARVQERIAELEAASRYTRRLIEASVDPLVTISPEGKVKDDRLRADLAEVGEISKGAIEQSRSLSHDLSPAVANMNDLAEVLQWLANRIRAQQGLRVNLVVLGDLRLHSEALALFLFRAVQEMLFNVVKHAQVREATVRVRRIGRHVCLSVSDQGRGFDPRELKEASGVGLFSIRERTELLGGRLKIESAKGQGSTFRLMVPDGSKTVGVGPRAYPLGSGRLPSLPSIRRDRRPGERGRPRGAAPTRPARGRS
jgi:PAS domain S-box-containing protein